MLGMIILLMFEEHIVIKNEENNKGHNMSASHEWTEWHLTPRGWEQGSWKIDFGSVNHKDYPDDRVLTCQYHERLSSPFSQWQKYVDEIWRSDNESDVTELLQKFSNCPEYL